MAGGAANTWMDDSGTSTGAEPSAPQNLRPALLPGVQLAGEMPSSAFAESQWLVQRDGQFLQLSELLYRVLEHADGARTLEELARKTTEVSDWIIDAPTLRHLITTKLMPLRLITVDGIPAEALPRGSVAGRSPLGVSMRMKMLSGRFVNPIAAALQFLFMPPVAVIVLAGIIAAHVWMYSAHGISSSLYQVLYTPGALLAVFAIVTAAGLFHEFGHAAALTYGGGHVRGIGAGLYLVFPAFYTDVTDSYRLGRGARLRTDVGGIYFHLIFALALIFLAAQSGSAILFLSVFLINIEIARQFFPFVRLDGYWVLADLTGIPDFFSQMGPFLRSLLPRASIAGSRLPQLRPAAKAVFAIYTLAAVPMLAYLFYQMMVRVPWLLSTTLGALARQRAFLTSGESVVTWALAASQMLLLLLPLVGTALIVYMLVTLLARLAFAGLSAPARRVAVAGTAAAALALVPLLWSAASDRLGTAGATAAGGPAVVLSPGEQVVQRAREAASRTNTMTADFRGVLGTDRFTGTLQLMRPNLARIAINGTPGLGRFEVVSDGREVVVYFPHDRQYSKFTARGDGSNVNAFVVEQVKFFFAPQTIGVAPGGRLEFIATERVGETEVDIIDAYPPAPAQSAGAPAAPGRMARYSVSRDTGVVRRVAWRRVGTPPDAATTWVELSNVRTDVLLDATKFGWTLPKDARPLEMPLQLDFGSAVRK